MTQRAANGPLEASLFVCSVSPCSKAETPNQVVNMNCMPSFFYTSSRQQKADSVGEVGLKCRIEQEKPSLMKKLYTPRMLYRNHEHEAIRLAELDIWTVLE